MGLFDGLEKLGLKKITEGDLFKADDQKKREKEEMKAKVEKKIAEEQKKEEYYLFDKRYVCPVCENHFAERTVKTGKARRVSSDLDLRPRYTGLDAIKYNIVFCKKCGYAALASAFSHISSMQRKLLKEEVRENFQGVEETGEALTYEEAITRFKMALYCSIVKHSRNSEKAYLCLQTAWMYRGFAEQLEAMDVKDEEKIAELKLEEQNYIKQAHSGFEAAMANELFPICGMDEMTFNYLLAELSRRVGKIEDCKKLLGVILVSKTASTVVKDRARRLKEVLTEEKSE